MIPGTRYPKLVPETDTRILISGQVLGKLFIDNLLVRIHFIIVMIRWTGLAPWEFEFPCLVEQTGFP